LNYKIISKLNTNVTMCTNFIKASIVTGVLSFASLAIFAQAPFTGTSQFRKFSLGINVGALRPSIITGGSNDFTKPQYTLGYGADLKYQFTHRLGAQLDFVGGKLKGDNSKDYWNGLPATDRPISSFETKMNYSFALSGVYTFGTINWLRATTKVVPYVTAGGGIVGYKPTTKDRATGNTTAFDNGKALNNFFVPVGVGLKFNLSEMINLDLGYRANIVDNDNFDGTYWHADVHRDKFSYGFLGIEFAFGKKGQKQLMFDNPASKMNDILQSQITHIQTEVDSLKLGIIDTDGDGVADIFDKEPNTPAGCPVDAHGVTRDTDGDGVPDCKDKELITPTQCQPVDADGIGKCPDPECCKNMAMADSNKCHVLNLPSISFKGNRSALSSDAKAMLATVAAQLKDNAECGIIVTGYPAASKASQALCNKRGAAIKAYLTEKEGISADRVDIDCEVGGGDVNTVDIKSK
jgi:opacity protein-like surface antigen/outer membrane protein OmpA-like peptidoglycan-associated protein